MKSILAIGVVAALSAGFGGCKNGSDAVPSATAAPGSAVPPNARIVAVTASEQGFSPASVPVKTGETVVLRFTRTTRSDCLKQVVIPDLNIKQDLPVNTAVDVVVKPDKPGKIAFQCWMGMFKGALDVSG